MAAAHFVIEQLRISNAQKWAIWAEIDGFQGVFWGWKVVLEAVVDLGAGDIAAGIIVGRGEVVACRRF